MAKYFSKNGGVIINISTTLPHAGVALQSHAGPAKSAIDALTRHLSVELGPKNIRVVGLAPGAISGSEGMRRLLVDDAVYEYLTLKSLGEGETFENLIPLQRMGYNSDIAPWAVFMASKGASYFTG